MLYNKILEKIILPFGDYVNHSSVMNELKKWRKFSTYSDEEVEALSKQNLSKILEYAVKNCVCYKGINILENGDPYKWIKAFPIMKKEQIRDNLTDLLDASEKKLIKCCSSGSSGIQGIVYENVKEQSIHRAMQLYWWEWSGYYIGKPIVQTGITPNRGFLKKMKDILFRTQYISAFKHSEEEILSLLLQLRKKKNIHFGGYASSLNVFSEIAQTKQIDDVLFDAAISWGDKLFDHYRKNIKKSFGCDVYETYGCSEGIMVAAKKDLDYYYIMSPHVYLEIVDDAGKEVPDGTMGHVLLTRLDNYTMPLIRYYVGDLAVKLPREKYPHSKELPFPLLEKIVGRDTDIVKTTSGKYLVVHFFTGIFEYIPQIKQFQVIQRKLSEIEIEYIKNEDFSNNILESIEEKIQFHLNEQLSICWREVDYIAPTSSGKPQLIQSFIK